MAVRNDTYFISDAEYNLARMIRDTMLRVIDKYPMYTDAARAEILGISVRTYWRYKKRFNLKMVPTYKVIVTI